MGLEEVQNCARPRAVKWLLRLMPERHLTRLSNLVCIHARKSLPLSGFCGLTWSWTR